LYCTVHALGEMAVAFPVAGAFSVYSSRFIGTLSVNSGIGIMLITKLDPAWGFAMGWK
jgi:amino acid transporter